MILSLAVRDGHGELRHDLVAGGGAQAQTDRHVERPLQPRRAQQLPGHRSAGNIYFLKIFFHNLLIFFLCLFSLFYSDFI